MHAEIEIQDNILGSNISKETEEDKSSYSYCYDRENCFQFCSPTLDIKCEKGQNCNSTSYGVCQHTKVKENETCITNDNCVAGSNCLKSKCTTIPDHLVNLH